MRRIACGVALAAWLIAWSNRFDMVDRYRNPGPLDFSGKRRTSVLLDRWTGTFSPTSEKATTVALLLGGVLPMGMLWPEKQPNKNRSESDTT